MTQQMSNYLTDPDVALLTKRGPRQIDYITLVQNFTDDKLFKLDFESLRENWILLPYGGEIYGMYDGDPAKGFTSYNADYSLNPFKPEQAINNPFMTEDGKFRKSPQFLVKFNREQYKQDHEVWKNYWNWKKNRNEARGTLEEQFGYDTKHAMHLVRLLNMGEEILTDGTVNVLRPDVELLLDIRAGKWSYDELVKFAEEKDVLIRTQLYNTSPLPKMPDLHYAAKLLMEAQDMCWSGQVNLRKVGE